MPTTSRIINPPNSVSGLLREAGYVPLPRLWVKSEAMEQIHAIAHTYQDEVNQIRSSIHDDHHAIYSVNNSDGSLKPMDDPKLDRDAAWAAYDALRHTR